MTRMGWVILKRDIFIAKANIEQKINRKSRIRFIKFWDLRGKSVSLYSRQMKEEDMIKDAEDEEMN